MEKNEIAHLCYLQMHRKEGKQLIEALKTMLAEDMVLPKPEEVLNQFGGAAMFAAYRSGQSSILKFIELHAKGYQDNENAKNKGEK